MLTVFTLSDLRSRSPEKWCASWSRCWWRPRWLGARRPSAAHLGVLCFRRLLLVNACVEGRRTAATQVQATLGECRPAAWVLRSRVAAHLSRAGQIPTVARPPNRPVAPAPRLRGALRPPAARRRRHQLPAPAIRSASPRHTTHRRIRAASPRHTAHRRIRAARPRHTAHRRIRAASPRHTAHRRIRAASPRHMAHRHTAARRRRRILTAPARTARRQRIHTAPTHTARRQRIHTAPTRMEASTRIHMAATRTVATRRRRRPSWTYRPS